MLGIEPVDGRDQADAYNRVFGELIALEQKHRSLRDRVIDS